jgi:hypothetical protein
VRIVETIVVRIAVRIAVSIAMKIVVRVRIKMRLEVGMEVGIEVGNVQGVMLADSYRREIIFGEAGTERKAWSFREDWENYSSP